MKASFHDLLRRFFRHALAPLALPICLSVACVAVVSVAGWAMGFEVQLQLYSLPLLFAGPPLIMVVVAGACLWVLLRERPKQPTRFLLQKLHRDWSMGPRILRGLPVVFIYPVFFGAFTSYKSTLGKIVPFHFDEQAAALDRFLHGGDAWKLFAIVLAHPLITFLINFFYNFWFMVMYFLVAFVAFMVTDLKVRAHYLTAFTLCWVIIGMIAATLLASAGPCYYAHFYNSGSFAYIPAYLREVNQHYWIPALETQEMLLSSYVSASPGMGGGISAAPSMHVSVATLNALFLSRYGRTASVLAWSYCLLIFLGSVHLGWHYAVDGYIAFAMTLLVWKGASWLVETPLHNRLLPPA